MDDPVTGASVKVGRSVGQRPDIDRADQWDTHAGGVVGMQIARGVRIELDGDTRPGEVSGGKWRSTIIGEPDRPARTMGIQAATLQLFDKVFPRPRYKDPEKGRVAAACADISAILLLILGAYVLQNTFGFPVSKPAAIGAVLFFMAYLLLARWVVARERGLEVAVLMIAVGVALFWGALTVLAGTIRHTQSTMLALGVIYVTFLLGRDRGLIGLLAFCGLLVFATAPEYHRAAPGEAELDVLKQLFTAITVLMVMYAVAALLRQHLVEKTEIALKERDAARQLLEQTNAQLAQLLAEKTEQLNFTVLETNKVLYRHGQFSSLTQMVAGMAHELGTPIGNAVLTASNMEVWSKKLSESLERDPEMTHKLLTRMQQGGEIISRNLDRINALVNTFKQVGIDKVDGMRRKGDLSETIERALLGMQSTLDEHGVKVQFDLTPGIAMDTYFYAIEQVITNLVTNAIIHGIDGQPNGRVTIQTKLSHEGQRVSIDVVDNGVGVPKSIQSKIFDPFFTTKQGQGGTGMGLSIVQHIVTRLLDGDIRLISRPGGTRFCVTIPRQASAPSINSEPMGETSPAPLA